jgi:hypothetical protein
MLPSNYVNEWLSTPKENTPLEAFLRNQYHRAIKEELTRESVLTVGSRVHAILNAICIGLELKGFINDHMIRWDDECMEISFIRQEGDEPVILNFGGLNAS